MSLLSPELVAELEAAGLPRHPPICRAPRCPRSPWRNGLCRPHHDAHAYRLEWRLVDRAVAGPVPPNLLSHQEVGCAVWILTQRDMSARTIAVRLHVSSRTVTRWRTAWREALQESK